MKRSSLRRTPAKTYSPEFHRANEARIRSIVAQADERGWAGCGDLPTRSDRQSHYFKRLSDAQRFALTYVVAETGCWEWVGAKKPSGYGQFCYMGRNSNAHRVAYELYLGHIPDGLTLDHLCKNKSCVNPAHLEPVTLAENTQRWAAAVTHCPAGHEFTPQNTMLRRDGTRRGCRRCHYERTSVSRVVLDSKKVRLLDEDIEKMRELRNYAGLSVKEIAEKFGVSAKYASMIINGSRKRRQTHTGPGADTLKLIRARSDERCEICTAEAAHTHHRRPRGLGSSRDPRINLCSNLLRLCSTCHDYVERHRSEALIAGWLVSRYSDPARVPVLIEHGSRYVYLTESGEYADDPPERVA